MAVVVGWNEGGTGFRQDTRQGVLPVLLAGTAENHLSPIAFHRGPLGCVGVFRHDHGCGDAAQGCGKAERRGVISRRVRGDAPGDGLVAKRKNRVHRAAEFERADLLEILALEEHRRPAYPVDGRGLKHRRQVGVRTNTRRRFHHVTVFRRASIVDRSSPVIRVDTHAI